MHPPISHSLLIALSPSLQSPTCMILFSRRNTVVYSHTSGFYRHICCHLEYINFSTNKMLYHFHCPYHNPNTLGRFFWNKVRLIELHFESLGYNRLSLKSIFNLLLRKYCSNYRWNCHVQWPIFLLIKTQDEMDQA